MILYTYPPPYLSTPQLLAGKYRITNLAVQGALARWRFLFFLLQGENKVNSYSDQLKLGQVCKFRFVFDNNENPTKIYQKLVYKWS